MFRCEYKIILYFATVLCLLGQLEAKKSKDEEKPAWAKKDIRDYTDADLERLLDQWDVSEHFISIPNFFLYFIFLYHHHFPHPICSDSPICLQIKECFLTLFCLDIGRKMRNPYLKMNCPNIFDPLLLLISQRFIQYDCYFELVKIILCASRLIHRILKIS